MSVYPLRQVSLHLVPDLCHQFRRGPVDILGTMDGGVMENVMMVAMTVLIMTMQIFVIERSMVFIHPSNDDKDLCE